MGMVRASGFSVSLDGFGAGPNQSMENPLGVGGGQLHGWLLPTQTFQKMLFDKEEGSTGTDNDFAAQGFVNIGAWILGRNMFGPERGPWEDMSWEGGWGDTPPYHAPTFILTNHPREPIQKEGGTTFYFVTEGIHAALEQAQAAAGEKDVRIVGGANTINQYLDAGLVDEMHYAISPVFLGDGERLFAGVDLAARGYKCARMVASDNATHVILERAAKDAD
ncbi:dihydrofolate reductase family protein [Teredinibacter turnerae]|uniref:dihydrofolate reductase family protein n=1 Tax=Teredinibacter turnerae TaxID=2426 RepID=UPI000374D081|nr:dihydrofolate reductase family protein [Teredinibacter turnerae]